MMKRNVVLLCRWMIELLAVLFLKGSYLDRNPKTDFSAVQDILFAEEAQGIAMIFWLLPFLVSLIEIGYSFYHHIVQFNFRYRGRKQYFQRLGWEYTCKAIMLSVLFSAGQLVYFHACDLISCLIVSINMCILCYSLNIMAAVLSLVFTKYIYALLLIAAVLIITAYLPSLLQWLPIAGSFYSHGIDVGAGVLSIAAAVFLRKFYLQMDLRGDFI